MTDDLKTRLYRAVETELAKISEEERSSAIFRGLSKTISGQALKLNRQADALNDAQRRIGWYKAHKFVPKPIVWTCEADGWIGRVSESVYTIWKGYVGTKTVWQFNGVWYDTYYQAQNAAWLYHLDVLKGLVE